MSSTTVKAEQKGKTKRTSYLEAIREAQIEEMRRDPAVFLMGEDLRANTSGVAAGLLEEFGPERVRDLPLSEAGFIGCAVGAAMTGLRPIVDVHVASFLYLAFDQLISQAAKSRYMFGGQVSIPVTYRAQMKYEGGTLAAHHSDRPHPMLMNVPGLKIVAPSSPADVKGLLKTSIREDDPVLFFEDSSLWLSREEIPEGEHLVPLGQAAIKREGTDVTVVAILGCVKHTLSAAKLLADEGVSVEVIDPRTLVPLDYDTILASVRKTGHLVVVDPAHRTCSAASEIIATVAQLGFSDLAAAPISVTAPDMQVPFSRALAENFFPNADSIGRAIRAVVGKKG